MFSLLFIKNKSVPKLVVNLLNGSRTFSQKNLVCKSSLLPRALFEKPSIHYIETQLWRSHLVKRWNQTQYVEKNTNVENNVILYKFQQIRLIKIAHIFGICVIVFWIFYVYFLYKDNFFSDFWIKSRKEFIQDNILAILSLTTLTALGPMFYLLYYMYSSHLIKCVILNKGGKHVTFVTLHPLKSKSIIIAPVDKVYCLRPRNYPFGMYTSVKINSHRFNYLIDKSGTFVNGDLFDHTVAWRK